MSILAVKKLKYFILLFFCIGVNAKETANYFITKDVDSNFFVKCMKISNGRYYEKCNSLNNEQFPQNSPESKYYSILKEKVDAIDNEIGSRSSNIPISMISASKSVIYSNNSSKYIITYHLLNGENGIKENYFLYNLNNRQRIELGSNFKIMQNGSVLIKRGQKYYLNKKGLYELKR